MTIRQTHRCGEHGTYDDKNGVTRCSICKADAPPVYPLSHNSPSEGTDHG